MVGFTDQQQGLLRRVDHVGLETVQRFNAHDNATFLRNLTDFSQVLDAPVPFLPLPLGRYNSRLAHRRVHRPRKDWTTHRFGNMKTVRDVLETIFSDGSIVAGNVPVWPKRATDGDL